MTADGPEHAHGDDHSHDGLPQQYGPQPVPMGITVGLAPMADGTDRVMVTYASMNGSWTVFYDRDGAIAHAQQLLGLAYKPPAAHEVVELTS